MQSNLRAHIHKGSESEPEVGGVSSWTGAWVEAKVYSNGPNPMRIELICPKA
jgi:hypothetical protein